ncbi:MAG: T9SS type A sorting domain-containing protein [candidate division Zixibacteria bacterium]|nr:T9SS type A sorting domain-containing protein [candidate division Zixibacteria bacterium]
MKVFDYTGADPFNSETGGRLDITDKCDTSPLFGGSGCVCDSAVTDTRPSLRRFIDFNNGGLGIICTGIDTRGDLNLNGISNEIADAEIYVNYFLTGLSAFDSLIAIAGPNAVEAATAESDVNRDGIPLTLEDLVYLIRIITGDALPLNKLTHDIDTTSIRHTGNSISSNTELGAVLIEIEGEAEASLLQEHMSMGISVLHGNTRIIVYDIGLGKLNPGAIILTDGEIVSVKAVDYNGSRMVVEFDFATDVTDDENALLPDEFQLQQNYPNPFNPTTTIEFALPERGAVELIIYNTLGQRVRSLASGMYGAGKYSVSWDGTDNYGRQVTSGVYYYRLRAGDVVQSRKMVLLK